MFPRQSGTDDRSCRGSEACAALVFPAGNGVLVRVLNIVRRMSPSGGRLELQTPVPPYVKMAALCDLEQRTTPQFLIVAVDADRGAG